MLIGSITIKVKKDKIGLISHETIKKLKIISKRLSIVMTSWGNFFRHSRYSFYICNLKFLVNRKKSFYYNLIERLLCVFMLHKKWLHQNSVIDQKSIQIITISLSLISNYIIPKWWSFHAELFKNFSRVQRTTVTMKIIKYKKRVEINKYIGYVEYLSEIFNKPFFLFLATQQLEKTFF